MLGRKLQHGKLVTHNNLKVEFPFFIPVYRPDYDFDLFENEGEVSIPACMVNSFLLYKDRERREKFESGYYDLRGYLGGFKGVLCTDSGAFQGLNRPLYLKNKKIIKFQNQIKSDIIAPLDLITPPYDKRKTAEDKMNISHKRIKEGLGLADYSMLAGIQQGGRFYDLRQHSIRVLREFDMEYYGIGSLVPFFNKKHNMYFACKVIADARSVIGEGKPMHVYGAGDPVELPFLFYAGANIFDSSSYAHYANGGYYMTEYGAVNSEEQLKKIDYHCNCPVCRENEVSHIFGQPELLQRHNLFVILYVIEKLRKCDEWSQVEDMINDILEKHTMLFDDSLLAESWEKFMSEWKF